MQSLQTRLALIGKTLLALLVIAALTTFADPTWGQRPQSNRQQPAVELLTEHPPVVNTPIDWIFLIDTSASMSHVEPGRQTIIVNVKDTLHRFISGLQVGDSLTMIVFDTTSRFASAGVSKTIRGQPDLNAAHQLVDRLSAQGDWTQTGAALKDALNEVSSRPDKARPAAIILFTDGKEDVRGIQNPVRIPDAIKLIPDQDVPFVFYVSLDAVPDPDLQKFIEAVNSKAPRSEAANGKAPPRAQIFSDPHGGDLSTVRAKIEEAITILRRPQPLKLAPDRLDLGTIRPGGRGDTSLDIESPVDTTVEVSMSSVPPDHTLTVHPETLVVQRKKKGRIQISLSLAEDAHEGTQEYAIELKPVDNPQGLDPATRSIPIKVIVHRPWYWVAWQYMKGLSPWMWLLLFLLLLILVAAVYFGCKWYIDGALPLDVIHIWFPRRRSAVLRTPEGPISLKEAITVLGAEGPKLRKSTASMEIRSDGGRHILSVLNGPVEFVNRTQSNPVKLQTGATRKLRHLDQVIMPGYQQPLVYHNSFEETALRNARRRENG